MNRKERGHKKMAEMLFIIWLVIVLCMTAGLIIGFQFGKTFGTKAQLEKYAELEEALDNMWSE